MNTWYREHVEPGLAVETAEVDAHPQLSRFLAHKQDGCAVRRHTRANPALFQHIINMLLHNLKFIGAESILLMAGRCCIFVE